jgi:hypothetical protein
LPCQRANMPVTHSPKSATRSKACDDKHVEHRPSTSAQSTLDRGSPPAFSTAMHARTIYREIQINLMGSEALTQRVQDFV